MYDNAEKTSSQLVVETIISPMPSISQVSTGSIHITSDYELAIQSMKLRDFQRNMTKFNEDVE